MMTIRPGDYWVADIRYTDDSTSKKRPVLVLWLDGQDVVVAAVSSASPRTVTDVPLADWQQSGLRVASTVRLSRLDCLEQSLLLVRLGRVSESDAQRLKSTWTTYVVPRF
jgi:mRNA interferase MazF